MKYFNSKNILILAFFIFILKCFQFYIMPMVSTDSAWTLSSFYDFLKNDNSFTSNFAHDYHGAIFSFNTLHYFLYPFFYFTNLNTTSFIIFHFLIIILTTLLIWITIKNKKWASLVVLSYLLDGYIYAFRSESYLIPLGILVIFIWSKKINAIFNSFITALIFVFSCYLHPMGGISIGLIWAYYIFSKEFINLDNYIKIVGIQLSYSICFIITFILLYDYHNLINLYKAFLTKNTDVSNHFDFLHFDLAFKYFLLGNTLAFILWVFYLSKTNSWTFRLLSIIQLIVLIYSGRSYYFPYILFFTILILADTKLFVKFSLPYYRILKSKLLIGGAIFIMFIHFFLNFTCKIISFDAGLIYKKILLETNKIKYDKSNELIFIPAQLSLECHSNKNIRIIHNFIRLFRPVEVPVGTVVYVYADDQVEWLKNNIGTFGDIKKWKKEIIIPFKEGVYGYKVLILPNVKPAYRIGFVKFTKTN